MRLADLAAPFAAGASHVVEYDPLGLNLHRYLGGLPVIPWPADSASVTKDALVVATVRTTPRLAEDLSAVEKSLARAEQGTTILLCLEDSFEAVPVPLLAETFSRRSWQIERLADLTATRIKTGVLLKVGTSPASDQEARSLVLHNALAFSDQERRRLQRRLDDQMRRPRSIATVTRNPDRERTDALEKELADLRQVVETLERQLEESERAGRIARRRLRRIEQSGSMLVGTALVRGIRQPTRLLRLPVDLARFVRRRRRSAESQAPRQRQASGETAGSRTARMPSSVATMPGTAVTASSGPAAPRLPISMQPARLRIATVAGRSLVGRLRAGADVVTIAAGGWRGTFHQRLASVDLLIVDALAGATYGSWRGLGDPGEVERSGELIQLLEAASATGVPSVLLLRDGAPAGLRSLQDRFDVVLRWEFGVNGWDPGVPLNELPWPTHRERANQPVHLDDPYRRLTPAEDRWLRTLATAQLERWIVGLDVDLGASRGTTAAVKLPAIPFSALAERSVIAVSSGAGGLIATAALAAGCRVVARAPIEGLVRVEGFAVAEHPRRALELLTLQSELPEPDQLGVRRQLLEFGATEERMIALATMLGLPVAESLRRAVGLSVLAVVTDQRSGAALARGLLGQTRRPGDVVVATGEPSDAPWLQELRAAGLRPVLYPPTARWWQMAMAAKRNLLAIWREGHELDATEVADIELLDAAPDRLAYEHQGALTVVSMPTLLASAGQVTEGLPMMLDVAK